MRLLSRAEVLKRIGIPQSTWYLWRSQGRFPAPVSIGSARVWREDDVETWLRQHTRIY